MVVHSACMSIDMLHFAHQVNVLMLTAVHAHYEPSFIPPFTPQHATFTMNPSRAHSTAMSFLIMKLIVPPVHSSYTHLRCSAFSFAADCAHRAESGRSCSSRRRAVFGEEVKM
eukprot:1298969-Prymnesium_polylepis.1